MRNALAPREAPGQDRRCAGVPPADPAGRAGAPGRLRATIYQTRQIFSNAVQAQAPQLLERVGVGPDSAAALLIAAGDNPERLGHEASFAALCGVSPIEASSGKTRRHRLNRGGDRQANAALHRIAITRLCERPGQLIRHHETQRGPVLARPTLAHSPGETRQQTQCRL